MTTKKRDESVIGEAYAIRVVGGKGDLLWVAKDHVSYAFTRLDRGLWLQEEAVEISKSLWSAKNPQLRKVVFKRKAKKPSPAPGYHFTIPIGDWSGDGHSIVKHYPATSAKPLKDVREAYFAAKKLHPDICPESFANKYNDGSIPENVVDVAGELGFDIDPDEFGPEDMARYTAWFINLGDPTVAVSIPKGDAETKLQMLPFYGDDRKKRHISFIGYGLLGD